MIILLAELAEVFKGLLHTADLHSPTASLALHCFAKVDLARVKCFKGFFLQTQLAVDVATWWQKYIAALYFVQLPFLLLMISLLQLLEQKNEVPLNSEVIFF